MNFKHRFCNLSSAARVIFKYKVVGGPLVVREVPHDLSERVSQSVTYYGTSSFI